MLKIFVLLCFLITGSITSFCQGPFNHPLSIGLKLGLNNYITYGDDETGNPTHGLIGNTMYFAFFLEKKTSRNLFISTEILYTWQDETHFIEIPVFLKWNVFKKLYIIGGPKIDMIVYTYFHNDTPIGYSAESGIQYFLTKRILLESRYAFGLRRHVDDFFIHDKGRRNTFRLGLGLHF
jgi:hypothetical protein